MTHEREQATVIQLTEAVVPTAGVVVARGGAVLLVRHGPGAAHLTGAWGIPAGGIDAGETARAAAVRELREETGLEVDPAALVELPTLYKARIARKGGDGHFSVRVFATRTYTGSPTSSDEGTPQWVPLREVRQLQRLLPNTADIVEAAVALLQSLG